MENLDKFNTTNDALNHLTNSNKSPVCAYRMINDENRELIFVKNNTTAKVNDIAKDVNIELKSGKLEEKKKEAYSKEEGERQVHFSMNINDLFGSSVIYQKAVSSFLNCKSFGPRLNHSDNYSNEVKYINELKTVDLFQASVPKEKIIIAKEVRDKIMNILFGDTYKDSSNEKRCQILMEYLCRDAGCIVVSESMYQCQYKRSYYSSKKGKDNIFNASLGGENKESCPLNASLDKNKHNTETELKEDKVLIGVTFDKDNNLIVDKTGGDFLYNIKTYNILECLDESDQKKINNFFESIQNIMKKVDESTSKKNDEKMHCELIFEKVVYLSSDYIEAELVVKSKNNLNGIDMEDLKKRQFSFVIKETKEFKFDSNYHNEETIEIDRFTMKIGDLEEKTGFTEYEKHFLIKRQLREELQTKINPTLELYFDENNYCYIRHYIIFESFNLILTNNNNYEMDRQQPIIFLKKNTHFSKLSKTSKVDGILGEYGNFENDITIENKELNIKNNDLKVHFKINKIPEEVYIEKLKIKLLLKIKYRDKKNNKDKLTKTIELYKPEKLRDLSYGKGGNFTIDLKYITENSNLNRSINIPFKYPNYFDYLFIPNVKTSILETEYAIEIEYTFNKFFSYKITQTIDNIDFFNSFIRQVNYIQNNGSLELSTKN